MDMNRKIDGLMEQSEVLENTQLALVAAYAESDHANRAIFETLAAMHEIQEEIIETLQDIHCEIHSIKVY